MTPRLRNNLMAVTIVVAFWIAMVIPMVVQAADPIITQSTSTSAVTSNATTKSTIKSPPPSAISPSFSTQGNDMCMVGVSGAVSTQILGISTGQAYTDENCLMLKNAKVLYDFGMRVAAVSLLCTNPAIHKSMENAGTSCPYLGSIGPEAQALWDANPSKVPKEIKRFNTNDIIVTTVNTLAGILLLGMLAN